MSTTRWVFLLMMTWFSKSAVAQGVNATDILGGDGDQWGHGWTASELGDGAFRLRITATSHMLTSNIFRVDQIQVKVYYTTVNGTDTSQTQDIRATGQATNSQAQDVRATGTDTSNRTQDVRTGGALASSDERDLRAIGTDTSAVSQEIRTTGQAPDNRTQDVKTSGEASSSATQDARVTGQDISTRPRPAC